MNKRTPLILIGCLFWAVFVNACNRWLLIPLVLDYAAAGLVALVIIVAVWFVSVPRYQRRSWIGFTVYSMLLGTGVGQLMSKSGVAGIWLIIIMTLGLMVVAWLMTRVRWSFLIVGAVGIIAVNFWLPMSEWSFLTHFRVAYHNSISINPGDYPALPMEVVQTPHGDQVVTLQNVQESEAAVESQATQANGTGRSLEDILRNYKHTYTFLGLTQTKSGFQLKTLSPSEVRGVNPFLLVNTFFPTIQAFWSVDNGQVMQYMAPTTTPSRLAAMAIAAGNLPSNLIGLANLTAMQERQAWDAMLRPYGGAVQLEPFQVVNGSLVGTWNGQAIRIPVAGERVVSTGAFTAPKTHQVLVSGPNLLQVISLDTQRVISEYRGDSVHPLSNDIVTGPINGSGKDVIFVNSSPAEILQLKISGVWNVLYRAPNPSLRFESSLTFAGDTTPEIITDDPSLVRDSPIRYFSSYSFQNGRLVRNWRVYHTNVVNVHDVQFSPQGPHYLVVGLYGSGQLFVLKRHHVPVVPVTSAALVIIILAGFGMRIMRRGARSRA